MITNRTANKLNEEIITIKSNSSPQDCLHITKFSKLNFSGKLK